jgi:membrane associated rhomboid family serine protease
MSVCYRHPNNEAYVRCQRCERFICPQCQVEAPVGFLCPEDAGRTVSAAAVGVANSAAYTARTAGRRLARSAHPVTWSLIIINAAVWGLQLVVPNFTYYLDFWPAVTNIEPWRMLTSAFAHDQSNPLHILLNMYSLFILGSALEPMVGKARFLWLYLLSLLAGSLGFLAIAPLNSSVVGASGAIFGLMGAYFVILRTVGAQLGQIGSIIAINLVFGFLLPGVAWEAHLGGLIGGALVAFIFAKTRAYNQRGLQAGLLVAMFAVIAVASYVITDQRIAAFING